MQTTANIDDQQLKNLMFHSLRKANPKLVIKLSKPICSKQSNCKTYWCCMGKLMLRIAGMFEPIGNQ